jgi:hypothetical protein
LSFRPPAQRGGGIGGEQKPPSVVIPTPVQRGGGIDGEQKPPSVVIPTPAQRGGGIDGERRFAEWLISLRLRHIEMTKEGGLSCSVDSSAPAAREVGMTKKGEGRNDKGRRGSE